MANLGENFYPKLIQIASELGMKPEDLIAVMISESGMDPSAVENKYKASGLIGFMPNTLKGLGFHGSWEDFVKLSGEDQLDYVKKAVQSNMKTNGGPFASVAQYYTSNLFPIALRLPGVKAEDPKAPILEANPERGGPNNEYSKKYLDIGAKIKADFESKAYHANPLFDKDKKGAITYGDMMRQINLNKQNPIYQKAIADMKAKTGYQAKTQVNSKPNESSSSDSGSLESVVDEYIKRVMSGMERLLPNHNILIKIAGEHEDSVEFAQILSTVLGEELQAKAYPCGDKYQIEVECQIAGPQDICIKAVKEVSETVRQFFKKATQVEVGIKYVFNKKSNRNPLDLKVLANQHRKFLLKYLKGN